MRICQISLLIGALALLFGACQQKQKKDNRKKSPKAAVHKAALNEEDKVVNLIMDLEEVKSKSAQVEKASQGKRHLATYVETPPSNTDPDYWVKVAEDNGSNYVTYYTFAVNGKTLQIRYYDVAQDSLISIKEWRSTTPVDER
ncbi:hypothetical protein KHS38_21870 [Mucilaginibacter sp. Bleaf8]|uniref:hypothetical protein n=1 Tax=Mucilaginibacter sp. Bleaf8 TaxID=2834430 RepID=UPI001BCDEA5A|nr:hypothetical protein [Mucilaginibacter sp. Bleaf8]MBS7567068.1 hypothetical protein [Mucilaginibacter sp. Bleaf8]